MYLICLVSEGFKVKWLKLIPLAKSFVRTMPLPRVNLIYPLPQNWPSYPLGRSPLLKTDQNLAQANFFVLTMPLPFFNLLTPLSH